MAIRKPLVQIDGQLHELPEGDFVNGVGSGGGGSTTLYSFDIVGSKNYQSVKLVYGDEGLSDGFVSKSNPLPVSFSQPSSSIATNFESQAGSYEILSKNQLRVGATISNQTDDVLYLSFGDVDASSTSYTILLPSLSTLTLSKEDFNGRIAACGAGVGKIVVTQFKVGFALPSGTLLKTINNQSIEGSGDITINPISDSASISTTVSGLNSTDVQSALSELYALLTQGLQSKVSATNGKIDISFVPDAFLGALNYMGTFDLVENLPLPTLQNKGDYYIAASDSEAYKTGDWAASNGIHYDKIDNTDTVVSVAGKTGPVVLSAEDITSGVFNPIRIPNLSWNKINSDLPTTVEEYGITNAAIKGTTLQDYGILNAVEKTQVNGVAGCCVDSIGNVRSMPVKVNNTNNYNFVGSDNGCAIVTTNTITVPANVLQVGDIVIVYNDTSSTMTITTSAVTAYISGIDVVKTSVSLSARGMCSIWFYASNKITISGDVA